MSKSKGKIIVRTIPYSILSEMFPFILFLLFGIFYFKQNIYSGWRVTVSIELVGFYLFGFAVLACFIAIIGYSVPVLLQKKYLTVENNQIVFTESKRSGESITIDVSEICDIKVIGTIKDITIKITKTDNDVITFQLCEIHYFLILFPFLVIKYNYLKLMYIFDCSPQLQSKFDRQSLYEFNEYFKLGLPSWF